MRAIGAWTKHILLAIAGLLVLLAPFVISRVHAYEATLIGVVTVKDGDVVLFGTVEVRLIGIAAPEDHAGDVEVGGPEATKSLRDLVEGKTLTCKLSRALWPAGICYLGALDIGEYQVRNGVARDCPRFSGKRYAKAEADAKARGHDLSKTYELPAYCMK